MRPTPLPHQIDGAAFLASRKAALLADAPRVGKTGASILAADFVLAATVLVITTATGRAQWGRELASWGYPRDIQVVYGPKTPVTGDAVVVGWHEFWCQPLHGALRTRRWDVLVPDEAHYACNVVNGTRPTARTIALYGKDGLIHSAGAVWPLTGTPMPNGAPDDLYPMLRGIAPERLGEFADWFKFIEHFCVLKLKRFRGKTEQVVAGGRNLDDLRNRLDGFWLRRTQEDVGIRPPLYSIMALDVPKLPAELTDCPDATVILEAAEVGDTRSLEMHMGPLRRITGTIKAHAVAATAAEHLEDRRIGKIVLMAWHQDVINVLWKLLAPYGVTGIDGRTPADARDSRVRRFQTDVTTRVFVGQIQAAGEAIDLSAADELWFVEMSFLPKDMSQGALRLTNHARKTQAVVRVCVLAGSVDEALAGILVPKVETIKTVMEQR